MMPFTLVGLSISPLMRCGTDQHVLFVRRKKQDEEGEEEGRGEWRWDVWAGGGIGEHVVRRGNTDKTEPRAVQETSWQQ